MNLSSRWMRFVWLAATTAIVVPLIAMQFTKEMNWAPFDFVFVIAMIVGFGLAFELLKSKTKSHKVRLIAGASLALAFLGIWAELAVGIFD